MRLLRPLATSKILASVGAAGYVRVHRCTPLWLLDESAAGVGEYHVTRSRGYIKRSDSCWNQPLANWLRSARYRACLPTPTEDAAVRLIVARPGTRREKTIEETILRGKSLRYAHRYTIHALPIPSRELLKEKKKTDSEGRTSRIREWIVKMRDG